MKNKALIVTAFILGIAVSSGISVCAAVKIVNANVIAYGNGNKVVSVNEALDTLYNSVDADNITPVGSILPYMGTSAPDTYLLCDGSVYNISDYQNLANHIKKDFGSYNYFGGDGETTFAVPDLRGEFLRGSGTNSHTNQGSGANVGVHQDGTVQSSFESDNNKNIVTTVGSYLANSDKLFTGKLNAYTYATDKNNYYNGKIFTSRPTNTSVNYIIKVK